jgi:hypothetical protein
MIFFSIKITKSTSFILSTFSAGMAGDDSAARLQALPTVPATGQLLGTGNAHRQRVGPRLVKGGIFKTKIIDNFL